MDGVRVALGHFIGEHRGTQGTSQLRPAGIEVEARGVLWCASPRTESPKRMIASLPSA